MAGKRVGTGTVACQVFFALHKQPLVGMYARGK
jgi:hypothetical protein